MKSDLAYARRLKEHDPRLDNDALASGSGVRASDIAADPKINPPALSPKQQKWLAAAVLACPRTAEFKTDIAYARRLKEQDHRLDNAALASGAGIRVFYIQADPKINAPALSPEQQRWLAAAKQAYPRPPNMKSDLAYARKLKEHDPRLDNDALASGSGVRASDIAADPKINPPALSPKQQEWLAAAVQARPRPVAMSDLAYARLLKEYDQRLGNAALASASGAQVPAIAFDPTINAPVLSPEQQEWLDAAVRARPRPPTLTSPLAYARMLKEQDHRLGNAALASASGAKVANIEADPTINPPALSPEQRLWLAAAVLAHPRPPRSSALAYARLLKEHDPRLGNAALASASGAMVTNIEADPTINPPALPPEQRLWLAAAVLACPRPPKMKSHLKYARLLKKHDPRLSNAALAAASRAPIADIEADPTINAPALSAEQQQWLATAMQACPRPPKCTGLAYARLLKERDPRLGNAALARGSGTKVSDIAADPKINPPALSAEQQQWLATATQECPRPPKCTALGYARLLKEHDPRLGTAALASASGAKASNIEKDAKKWSVQS